MLPQWQVCCCQDKVCGKFIQHAALLFVSDRIIVMCKCCQLQFLSPLQMATVLTKIIILLIGLICCILPAFAGCPPITVSASPMCPPRVCAERNTRLSADFRLQMRNPLNGYSLGYQRQLELKDSQGYGTQDSLYNTVDSGGYSDVTSSLFFYVAYPGRLIGMTITLYATISVSGCPAAKATTHCTFLVVQCQRCSPVPIICSLHLIPLLYQHYCS